ncbi:MAG: hypothetical protein J2P46_15615 [Zavarzinella sp.]|nr:hypothetical protein [Zavarzinella sp.]
MKLASSVLGLLGVSVLFAAPPVGGPDSPDPKRAEDCVRQLGSPKYRDRERAATELIHMGRAAKAALLAGKADPDPEVQTRCQQLLPQALSLDLMYRLDRYRKDTDARLQHNLPLLKLYEQTVGTDANARKLYADMLTVNGALLEAVEEEPDHVTERVQQRYQEMYQEMFGNAVGGFRGGYRPGILNPAEICCVLFAASTPAYKPVQPDWMLSNLYAQPNFTTPLKDEKNGTAYRKVLFHYLDARMDDNTINQCVWMLCQHRIKEGADLLAKALADGKASQVYTKATAMCAVGTLGTREHVKAFGPLLKDETQIQPFFVGRGQKGQVKVCDVALAMTIYLSGKNPKDYGFELWQVFPNQLIQYHQLGFGSDEERASAFKKWEADVGKSAPPK